MHALHIDKNALMTISVPWICFGMAFTLFRVIGKVKGTSNETIGALTLLCGVGNTAFVGLPVVSAILGDKGLTYAVALDQAGTWLCLATVGTFSAILYSKNGDRMTVFSVTKRISTYPPLLALAFAIATRNIEYAAWILSLLKLLSAAIVPLALLTVGASIKLASILEFKREITLGLLFKCVAFPLFISTLFSVFHIDAIASDSAILEAAQGPSIGAAAIAIANGLNVRLTVALVAVGVPFGLLMSLLVAQFF